MNNIYTFFPTKAQEEEEEEEAAAQDEEEEEEEDEEDAVRAEQEAEPVDPNNPWKIRKVITRSDLVAGKLKLPHQDLMDHVFQYWTYEKFKNLAMGNKCYVKLWDLTDNHTVRYEEKNKVLYLEKGFDGSYVLDWKNLLGNQPILPGAEIGLYWDSESDTFKFKVLREN